jgi:hypothetical protein
MRLLLFNLVTLRIYRHYLYTLLALLFIIQWLVESGLELPPDTLNKSFGKEESWEKEMGIPWLWEHFIGMQCRKMIDLGLVQVHKYQHAGRPILNVMHLFVLHAAFAPGRILPTITAVNFINQ